MGKWLVEFNRSAERLNLQSVYNTRRQYLWAFILKPFFQKHWVILPAARFKVRKTITGETKISKNKWTCSPSLLFIALIKPKVKGTCFQRANTHSGWKMTECEQKVISLSYNLLTCLCKHQGTRSKLCSKQPYYSYLESK